MGQERERGNTQKLSQIYRNKELSILAKGNREQAYSHPNEQRVTTAKGSRELQTPRLHFLKTLDSPHPVLFKAVLKILVNLKP